MQPICCVLEIYALMNDELTNYIICSLFPSLSLQLYQFSYLVAFSASSAYTRSQLSVCYLSSLARNRLVIVM